MNETSVIIAGIGGQGIQLLSKVLANAALADGRHVMLAAEYGGEMRGGRSFAAVVVGPAPLRSLPVLEAADMAIVLHEKFWEQSEPLLRRGGLAFVEGEFLPAVAAKCAPGSARRLVGVDAIACANAAGSAMGGGLAMLAAFCAHTGITGTDGLVRAMTALTPSYRSQHVPANEKAIRAGAGAALRQLPAEACA